METPDTEFVVHGPFDVGYDSPRASSSKRISREHVKVFWASSKLRSVSQMKGCYVFALDVGRGHTPWYVGQASKTFRDEALHDHKLVHYNEVLYAGRRGRPVLFFIAKGGAGSLPRSQLNDLETFLIQTASYRNSELMNKQKTKLPRWSIRGVLRRGRGRAPANAKQFSAMMRIG